MFKYLTEGITALFEHGTSLEKERRAIGKRKQSIAFSWDTALQKQILSVLEDISKVKTTYYRGSNY